MSKLPQHVRLRADPSKIRISVRKLSGGLGGKHPWLIQLRSRLTGAVKWCCDWANSPDQALDDLLGVAAKDKKFPGIDLDMGWAYRHPQAKEE